MQYPLFKNSAFQFWRLLGHSLFYSIFIISLSDPLNNFRSIINLKDPSLSLCFRNQLLFDCKDVTPVMCFWQE